MTWEQRVEEKLDKILEEIGAHNARLAVLEERTKSDPSPKRSLVRDGGITISGGVVGAALSFIAQHWGGGK